MLRFAVVCFITLLGCFGGDSIKLPVTPEPVGKLPTTDQPTTNEPTTDEPTTDEPTTDEPIGGVSLEPPDDPLGRLALDEGIGGVPIGDSQIIFRCVADSGRPQLCIINGNGSGLSVLFDFSPNTPKLSPNKDRVAYVIPKGDPSAIFVKSVDRAFEARITAFESGFRDPDWSPDGKRLVISNQWNLFIIDADGGNLTQITQGKGAWYLSPSWSANGQRIAFAKSEGDYNIHMINVDGTDQIRLTNHPSDDEYPDWSPNGDYVAFASNRQGEFEVYIVDVFTFDETQVTNNNGYLPSWSPDGNKIAFKYLDKIKSILFSAIVRSSISDLSGLSRLAVG